MRMLGEQMQMFLRLMVRRAHHKAGSSTERHHGRCDDRHRSDRSGSMLLLRVLLLLLWVLLLFQQCVCQGGLLAGLAGCRTFAQRPNRAGRIVRYRVGGVAQLLAATATAADQVAASVLLS